MLPFSEYKNTGSFPVESDFTEVYITHKGKMVGQCSGTQWREMDAKNRPLGAVEIVLDDKAFEFARKAWNIQTATMEAKFQDDMFEEFGVEDDPQRHNAYSYAWEHGHSGGYSEIYNVFSGLVDYGLVKTNG